jgi:predicted DNA-binding transcriptional regulator YafY
MLVRQWRLVQLLHASRLGVSASRVAAALGTSRATVYRDIGVLGEAGVAIGSDVVTGEVRYKLDGHAPPALGPTPLQMAALRLARSALAPLEGTSLVRELDAWLGRDRGVASTARGARVSAAARSGPASRSVVADLDRALQLGLRVRLQYRGARDARARWREADPVALRLADDQLYLVAWDLERGEWRTFKVARIQFVQVTEARADAHPAFDETALFRHAVRVWSGQPVEVAVRLSERVAWMAAEWPLVEGQRVEAQPDGGAIVRATVAGVVEAMRWVLGWGEDAEALEPVELREAVREQVEGAARKYRGRQGVARIADRGRSRGVVARVG